MARPATQIGRLRVEGFLAGCCVLSSTLLIPAIRPFFAAAFPGEESAMHAFMAVGMLGGILGAPVAAFFADRSDRRRQAVALLAATDGVLLAASAFAPSVGLLLAVRFLQGAANLGALSILLASVRRAGATESSCSSSVNAAAASMMVALAAGAPLGTLALCVDPRAPLLFGAALALAVGLVALALPPWAAPGVGHGPAKVTRTYLLRWRDHLWLPAALCMVDRFAVGTLVVTFTLHAHHVLHLSDSRVGALYSWFLLPFAAATYPIGHIAHRIGRPVVIRTGLVGNAVCFGLLGFVSAKALSTIMVLAGVASAAVYAPTCFYAAAVPVAGLRATAMGVLNAGGALGMLSGTAVAGILSAVLRAAGWGPSRYAGAFLLAATVFVIAFFAFRNALRRLGAERFGVEGPAAVVASAGAR